MYMYSLRRRLRLILYTVSLYTMILGFEYEYSRIRIGFPTEYYCTGSSYVVDLRVHVHVHYI